MADYRSEWLRLPSFWSHGVTRDGRIFFIDEEAHRTTWLHPATGEAVISGHRKTPDLPTGWEEGYTFEGARYYINHNEWKVTCKHPVTGHTSQENCIFVMNDDFRTAAAMASQEKKDRPVSVVSEVSTYTMASEMALLPMSPAGRSSRPSKKIHNFGKRSNSIKRNANAPVMKRGWLYKQDSTGMKLWKKRWFVLADLCLFYYRDEKEEGILGSILLPSFKIAPVSPEDHINRKYAFKASHPNMRTYYFYTETAKEMDSWMKAMIEAALVQTEPVKRTEKLASEIVPPKDVNHVPNHKMLVNPELQNNQKNMDPNLGVQQKDNPNITHADKYCFETEGLDQRKPLTKINSIKSQPAKSESGNVMPGTNSVQSQEYKSLHTSASNEQISICPVSTPVENVDTGRERLVSLNESGRGLQRTNSMVQLEQWVRTQKVKGQEEEPRSITCYQTLPRNLPSYRTQVMPCYRTMPHHSRTRPDSICSASPSAYNRVLRPPSSEEKRKSMRDDTMWQLYEWQQRQVYHKHGTLSRHGTLSTPVTMMNIVDQSRSIPPSPSHSSLAPYHVYSPLRSYNIESKSEALSPVLRGDMTIDSMKSRRHRTPVNRFIYPPNRRSMPAGIPVQTIPSESLQGKTPEELTLLLIKLRRQQAEVNGIREHTATQLMQLNLSDANPKNDILIHHLQRNLMYLDYQMKENEPLIATVHTMIENSAPRPQVYKQLAQQDDYRETIYSHRRENLDIDGKLSQLCEQDKVVCEQEEKLQQLHKEKHTLEQALLAASQEIEMNAQNPTVVQSVALQRDVLQNGLLSTCREISRATAELERTWKEYEKLEYDVTVARTHLQQQLDRCDEVQVELTAQQRPQIQKELWRIDDVMEGLSQSKQQRRNSGNTGTADSQPGSASTSRCRQEEDETAPPRPPLPQLFDLTERAPSVPPHPTESIIWPCSARNLVHQPDEMKIYLEPEDPKHGADSGPDYRLYKSEPELTTVTEVDESNVDEKSETVPDKESVTSKVPPRSKSPMPESSTIASYVTLRKHRKMDGTVPHVERPKSAVEQLFLAEGPRPRMSVEEQLERIKRHQQASLKDKRKGLNLITLQDQSPAKSLSREKNQIKPIYSGDKYTVHRNKTAESNIEELEAAVQNDSWNQHRETVAEEIARLKEEHIEPNQEKLGNVNDSSGQVLMSERCSDVDSNIQSPDETVDKKKDLDGIKSRSSVLTVAPVVNHKTDIRADEENAQEGVKMINISNELAADTPRNSKLVAEQSLSSPLQPPTSPSHPQLTEGSHFMCV
ncbi:pleckstrin homology domain-containing family A member 5 isoform X2 [Stegostoma tigrinum]|uniref:pleckstrin homology domain-containing family A member 5 isoform X2 n=1 Tax=Stegostoma tigrinum TaxID=3053191 RepID=UPI0028706135|nr:pleckstrin homology domain-containing family A member 5 isoform X2 [Stegostoma tigrinum]